MKLDFEYLAGKVSEKEVVILGICRNVEKDLESDIRNLLAAFSDFSKIYFRIVESDSTDLTLLVLETLSVQIPNFEFISFENLQSEIPSRVERIAYCRNKCLDFLKTDDRLRNCSYVAVSDLDGVNSLLDREGVLSCWAKDDWDGCTANQLGPYYDIYALRHPEWSPDDCWRYETELLKQGMNPISARRKAVYARQKKIPVSSPWIKVDSAFGGLAIYSRESLSDAIYSGVDFIGAAICEHVTLHQGLASKGFTLFINPLLINHGWSDHSRPHRAHNKVKRVIRLLAVVLQNFTLRRISYFR
jgi:glycosyltransferase involved in cell wall biosynthesis